MTTTTRTIRRTDFVFDNGTREPFFLRHTHHNTYEIFIPEGAGHRAVGEVSVLCAGENQTVQGQAHSPYLDRGRMRISRGGQEQHLARYVERFPTLPRTDRTSSNPYLAYSLVEAVAGEVIDDFRIAEYAEWGD